MRVNIQSVRDSKRKRWGYDRNRRREGEQITQASPLALHCESLSKRRKTGSCLVLQNRRAFFYCTLLKFNSWRNGQLVAELHRTTQKDLQIHTYTNNHREDAGASYEAEHNKFNTVNSEVKAAVLKRCQGWQILLLPYHDHCIKEALLLLLSVIIWE